MKEKVRVFKSEEKRSSDMENKLVEKDNLVQTLKEKAKALKPRRKEGQTWRTNLLRKKSLFRT